MDYLPKTDEGLLVWSGTFGTKLSADFASLGIDSATAAEYAVKQAAYSAALALAKDPQTRGGSTIFAKRMARKDLVTFTRQVAQQIVRTMSVTDQQRHDLGLTVADKEPTPQPIPSFAPTISVVWVKGRVVRIRMADPENPSRRGKPPAIDGMAVFAHVGETAPTEASAYTFQGNTTRTVVNVTFPASVEPGAKVWFTAFYFNERKQSGPSSDPVSAHIQFGGVSQAQ